MEAKEESGAPLYRAEVTFESTPHCCGEAMQPVCRAKAERVYKCNNCGWKETREVSV